jgi:hypothetical protein
MATCLEREERERGMWGLKLKNQVDDGGVDGEKRKKMVGSDAPTQNPATSQSAPGRRE